MVYVFSRKNCFRWPAKSGILTYELEDIIVVIDLPFRISWQKKFKNKNDFLCLN